jgi:phosphopantetheine adenylyltransferase
MSIFFRGIRSWEKDGKDERALQILNTWGPLLLGPLVWPVPTMYLEGNPKYNHVSSTLIRSLCSKSGTENQKALEDLVPPNVVDLVAKLYSKKEE